MSNVAIVVPEYNEPNLEERLDVFNELGKLLDSHATVVVVDDASTNGNRELLAAYVSRNNPSFQPYFMKSNGKKVGAIKEAVKALPSDIDTIILTDFDSYLRITPEALNDVRGDLQSSNELVGGTFRLKPANRKGILGRLQTVEYEVSRAIMHFLQGEGKSFCVPGASAVYKREVLERLLEQHSGRHNGDDKELTVLAMKNGGQLKYWNDADVETIVPSTPRALFRQRVRYSVGALETYAKEFPFYVKQALTALKGKRFGFLTGFEIYSACTFPIGAYFLGKTISDGNLALLERYYLTDVALTSAWLLYGRREVENKVATALTVPLLPAYRLGILVPARIGGYIRFAAEAGDDALLRLYVNQQEIVENVGSVFSNIGGKVTTAAKNAATAAIMPITMHLK